MHATYNARTFFGFVKQMLHTFHIPTTASYFLMDQLDDFFTSDPNGQVLIVCHSQGSSVTNLALKKLPQHLRQRIDVVALAPTMYIQKEYCNQANHYRIKGDPVPCLYFWQEATNVTWLPPVPGWDPHLCEHPSFQKATQDRIENFFGL